MPTPSKKPNFSNHPLIFHFKIKIIDNFDYEFDESIYPAKEP